MEFRETDLIRILEYLRADLYRELIIVGDRFSTNVHEPENQLETLVNIIIKKFFAIGPATFPLY